MESIEKPDSEGFSVFENWLDGLPEEIRYWRHYIQTQGGEYPDDFLFRLRDDTFVDERDGTFAESLECIGAPEVSVLDVGSGPLTNLGKQLRKVKLKLYPCDPLADVYGWLLDSAGVVPPVRTLFADVENLSMYFPHDFFDGVHCCNALDHSYDPLGGILEMVKVVNPQGFIQLGHFENEAEHMHYSGLHHWNFTERDGDFVMWNRKSQISLRQFAGDAIDVSSRRFPVAGNRDWILVHIRKRPGVEKLYATRRANLPVKYHVLLGRVLREHMDAIDDAEAPSRPSMEAPSHRASLSGRIRARLRRML